MTHKGTISESISNLPRHTSIIPIVKTVDNRDNASNFQNRLSVSFMGEDTIRFWLQFQQPDFLARQYEHAYNSRSQT